MIFLLYDVMPHVYASFHGAKKMCKIFTDVITEAQMPQLMNMSKSLLLNKLRQASNHLEGKIVPIFCYDGRPKRKLEKDKDYKANRVQVMPINIRQVLLNTVKNQQGFHLINKDEEADDLLATAKHKITKQFGKDSKFYIFSRDNDLLQLCDDNTVFVDAAGGWGNVKDKKYLMEKFGLDNFKKVVLYKVCFGDPSDNITGIFKGKRKKPIIEKINSSKSVKEFINDSGLVTSEMIPQIKNLMSMIRLRDNLPYEKVLKDDDNIYGDIKL